MGFSGCLSSSAVLESPNKLMGCHHISDFMSSNFDFLLHKDFPQSPSTSKSSTNPCSTTEPNKSTEHNAIQKGSIFCNMAATDAGRLLSSPFCGSSGFVD